MFKDLPKELADRVKEHLANDEFDKAKNLHDLYTDQRKLIQNLRERTNACRVQ